MERFGRWRKAGVVLPALGLLVLGLVGAGGSRTHAQEAPARKAAEDDGVASESPSAQASPEPASGEETATPPALEGPRTIRVEQAPRPLYGGPASYFGRLGEAAVGEVLQVLEERRRWVRVRSRAASDRGWTLAAAPGRSSPRDRHLIASLQSSTLGIGLVTKGFAADRARRRDLDPEMLHRLEERRLDPATYGRFVDEGGFGPEGDLPASLAGDGEIRGGPGQGPGAAPPAGPRPDRAGEAPSEVERSLEQARDALLGRQKMGEESFLDLLDETAERELGRGIAAEVLQREGTLHRDPSLEAYVTSVLAWVADHGSRPELPLVLGLFEDAEPRALSLPGGYVFVSVGLIRACRNEAELAGVLAHEVAHVTLRHGLAQLDRAKYRLQANDALREMDQVLASQGAVEALRPAVWKDLEQAATEIYTTILAGRSKPREFEADGEAVRTMARAGYDPGALAELLERWARSGQGAETESGFLASHPPSAERAARIRTLLSRVAGELPTRRNEERFLRRTAVSREDR